MASSFFSVDAVMIVTGTAAHDIYINSSSLSAREHYICLVREGSPVTAEDLASYVAKYRRLYVQERDRSRFVRGICQIHGQGPEAKTKVLKDSAIHHLKSLFDHEATTEVLTQTLVECREVVESMIHVLDGFDTIDQLRDLIASLSYHDFYTFDHSINVAMYCIVIYRLLYPEASQTEIVQAGLCGLLHDLGKIRIPTQILNKTEKLTDEEFAEIRRHPGYGFEMLQGKQELPKDVNSALIARVVHEHHENYDGTGYPCRLGGEAIHELSRITAIADFFDAVTTKRSYHEPLNPEDAVALMTNSSGKKIDPELFELFVDHIEDIRLNRELHQQVPNDFDPCQPHRVLPLIPLQPLAEPHGEIRVLVDQADDAKSMPATSKLKIIDAKKHAAATKPKKSA